MIKHGLLGLCLVSSFSFTAIAAEPEMDSPFKKTGENTVEASDMVTVEAQVVSVDKKTREIKLKDSDGQVTSVIAGDEIKNFSQIRKGDRLKIRYMESVALELKKGGKDPIEMTESTEAARAQAGQKPAGAVVDKITARGTVMKTDSKTQMITVKGPNKTVNLHVAQKDVFKKIKKGDQIEATFTEAMAVSVESVKK